MVTEAKQLSLWTEVEEPSGRLEYDIRKSTRARRLSVKVYPGGRVEVVVPRRTGATAVERFVDEHREWIEQHRRTLAESAPPAPFRLPEAIDLPAIEQRYEVRYEPRPREQAVHFRTRNHTVVLQGKTGDNVLCVAALKRWLTSMARRELEPRLQELSKFTGYPYTSVHIRGQRTRWGSYSSKGTVSLNYCLLFLDPSSVRYLLVHELCHARQMNHSRRFWRLVETHEPDYRRLDKSLADSWEHIPAWLGLN